MQIKLSPVRHDIQLVASVQGDILTVNGDALDFSPLQEGESLPASAINCPWLVEWVSRINGEIHLTLLLPHGRNAPLETRFPAAFVVPISITDGEVPLPAYESPHNQDEVEATA